MTIIHSEKLDTETVDKIIEKSEKETCKCFHCRRDITPQEDRTGVVDFKKREVRIMCLDCAYLLIEYDKRSVL